MSPVSVFTSPQERSVSPTVMEKPRKNPPTTTKLLASSLFVDPVVQRTVNPSWITSKLAEGFNPDGLATIVVSARPGGAYHVIDGQHRVELCRQAEYNQPLDCLVYKGLTLAEEALMFLVLNNKTSVQALPKFKVRVIEGEEGPVAMNELLVEDGWKLQTGKAEGSFSAVAALEKVYTGWNRVPAKNIGVCSQVLSVIKGAWGLDPNGVNASIITGLGLIFIRHGNRIDVRKLVGELHKYPGGPKALVQRARSYRDSSGGRMGDAIATNLINLLNKNRPRDSRFILPAWMSDE